MFLWISSTWLWKLVNCSWVSEKQFLTNPNVPSQWNVDVIYSSDKSSIKYICYGLATDAKYWIIIKHVSAKKFWTDHSLLQYLFVKILPMRVVEFTVTLEGRVMTRESMLLFMTLKILQWDDWNLNLNLADCYCSHPWCKAVHFLCLNHWRKF